VLKILFKKLLQYGIIKEENVFWVCFRKNISSKYLAQELKSPLREVS